MPLADQKETSANLNPDGAEELQKFGITRVSVDFFHLGAFRYSNLKDAIAQAKRQQSYA